MQITVLEPKFHSNPVAKKEGSLVFYDYGWDFLDFLKKAGFKDAYMLGYYEIFYGYIGNALQFIFVGKKWTNNFCEFWFYYKS